MPIVSQRITGNSLQKSGRRRVSYEFIDHTGAVHCLHSLDVDAATDVDADLLARVAGIESGLSESEEQSFTGNPLTATFKHTNKRKVIRRLLVAAMRDENPKAILRLKPIINWVRANYTGVQIANYLNITIQQTQRLANRFDALVLVQTTLDADGSEIIE